VRLPEDPVGEASVGQFPAADERHWAPASNRRHLCLNRWVPRSCPFAGSVDGSAGTFGAPPGSPDPLCSRFGGDHGGAAGRAWKGIEAEQMVFAVEGHVHISQRNGARVW